MVKSSKKIKIGSRGTAKTASVAKALKNKVWEKAKSYVGLKQVDAVPMSRGNYCKFKGWNLPEDENSKDKGYLIKYPDGYVSWSPTKQFEDAYMSNKNFDYSAALYLMKQGHKVCRKGWNGKKMWICLGEGGTLKAGKFWNKHTKDFAKENGGDAEVLPYFIMKTADNKILMGWLASQTDMLASDWCIVE